MSIEQTQLLMIKAAIGELDPTQNETCKQIASIIRQSIQSDPPYIGALALALVGVEEQIKASEQS